MSWARHAIRLMLVVALCGSSLAGAVQAESSQGHAGLPASAVFDLACFRAAYQDLSKMTAADVSAFEGLGLKREGDTVWDYEGLDGRVELTVLPSRTTVTYLPVDRTVVAPGVLEGFAQRAKRVTLTQAGALAYDMDVAPEGVNAPSVRDRVIVKFDGEWVNSSRWVVWGPLPPMKGR